MLCIAARNNTTNLAPCTHEEADTRMLLPVVKRVQECYRKIVLRTVDTGLLVLVIAFDGILQEQPVQHVEVWAAIGSDSNFRYLASST